MKFLFPSALFPSFSSSFLSFFFIYCYDSKSSAFSSLWYSIDAFSFLIFFAFILANWTYNLALNSSISTLEAWLKVPSYVFLYPK